VECEQLIATSRHRAAAIAHGKAAPGARLHLSRAAHPGPHKHGYLNLSEDGGIMMGNVEQRQRLRCARGLC